MPVWTVVRVWSAGATGPGKPVRTETQTLRHRQTNAQTQTRRSPQTQIDTDRHTAAAKDSNGQALRHTGTLAHLPRHTHTYPHLPSHPHTHPPTHRFREKQAFNRVIIRSEGGGGGKLEREGEIVGVRKRDRE